MTTLSAPQLACQVTVISLGRGQSRALVPAHTFAYSRFVPPRSRRSGEKGGVVEPFGCTATVTFALEVVPRVTVTEADFVGSAMLVAVAVTVGGEGTVEGAV